MRFVGFDFDAEPYFTIDGVLAPHECRSLVRHIEALGPTLATANGIDGPSYDARFRNHGRVRFEDEALAARLFARVADRLPNLLGRIPSAARPEFRGYRYRAGEFFAPHADVGYVRDDERSLLTFMVYLNDDFTGGRTRFVDIGAAAVPRAGRAVLFQHTLRHEGELVQSGVKYAVRTNVVYRRANLRADRGTGR